jgi:glycosyltransferase involved in cell wall biosynthesis
MLKKRNMDPSTWANLRIDERIAEERELLKAINGGVSTSTAIRDTFKNDYDYDARYFLPPCVDDERYRPRDAEEIEPIWKFLSELCGIDPEEIKGRKLVTEISRTDKTKRKDTLIKAFARVKKEVPEALLMVSVDPNAGALHDSLLQLIGEYGLRDDAIVLGSVWEQLPLLYNATSVYCTPSVMEGFGMSAQEAAATAVPVVSSNLVPFVCEYLLGTDPEAIPVDHQDPTRELLVGDGGVVVPADFIEGFAAAIVRLLKDDDQRLRMGARAREITVPYFTWHHLTRALLNDLGVSADRRVQHA